MPLLISILLVLVCLIILYQLTQGAIFLPTKPQTVQTIVNLASVQAGQRVVDLGSGDGRILIAFAKQGVRGVGYEFNPLLAWWSRFLIHRAGVSNLVQIYTQNFWSVDLRSFDAVIVFGMSHIMEKLGEKLNAELKPQAEVISNVFRFPNLVETKQQDGVHVYKITN